MKYIQKNKLKSRKKIRQDKRKRRIRICGEKETQPTLEDYITEARQKRKREVFRYINFLQLKTLDYIFVMLYFLLLVLDY